MKTPLKTLLPAFRLLLIAILMAGCSTPYIITVLKNQHAFPGNYNRIMVIGVVNTNDTDLRKKVEAPFVESLRAQGYDAVSSFAVFGATGLHDLRQEETYISLCDKGVDAVLTVALIDKIRKNVQEPVVPYTRAASFYYDRIWRYKEWQLHLPVNAFDSVMTYSWEMILFDLSTLEPHYIAETRQFTGAVRESIDHTFWNDMVRKLRKDKFLKKRTAIKPIEVGGPRAF